MADDRTHDLGPGATSALGAAYDNALRSLPPKAFEDYSLLRYWLARHLITAAFAGEKEPDVLRKRAIAYVDKWFKPCVPQWITPGPPPAYEKAQFSPLRESKQGRTPIVFGDYSRRDDVILFR